MSCHANWQDAKLVCRECGAPGLRYGSKSRMCGNCFNPLRGLIKANIEDVSLQAVINRFKHVMLEQYGLIRAARDLQVDQRLLVKWAVDAFGLDEAAKLLRVSRAQLPELCKAPSVKETIHRLQADTASQGLARFKTSGPPAQRQRIALQPTRFKMSARPERRRFAAPDPARLKIAPRKESPKVASSSRPDLARYRSAA